MSPESREIIDALTSRIDGLQDEIRELKREANNQHVTQMISFMSMCFTVGVFILAIRILAIVR